MTTKSKTLKASELIEKLVKIISIYGDLDVFVDDFSYITDVYKNDVDINEWEESSWIQIDTDYDLGEE
jgi:hypothetical protein